jgi:hypothetical protein
MTRTVNYYSLGVAMSVYGLLLGFIRVYYNPSKPDQFCVNLDQPVSKAA